MMDGSEIKTPGERLRYIREALLKLSRADIFKKYALSPDTLIAWESGKIQISQKGIERCIKIYTAENIIISQEWLLTGKGLGPHFSFDLNRYLKTLSTDQPTEKINDNLLLAKEIDFFRSLSPNSIIKLVSTEEMRPVYSMGDYVGGRFRTGEDIRSCVNKNCIVITKNGDSYIRRITPSKNIQKYNLISLNPDWDGDSGPVLFNVEIECAAVIIWHRKIEC